MAPYLLLSLLRSTLYVFPLATLFCLHILALSRFFSLPSPLCYLFRFLLLSIFSVLVFFLSLSSYFCFSVSLSTSSRYVKAVGLVKCLFSRHAVTPPLTYIDSIPIPFAKHFQRGFPLADLCIKVYAK